MQCYRHVTPFALISRLGQILWLWKLPSDSHNIATPYCVRGRAPLPTKVPFFVHSTCSKLHPAKCTLYVLCSPYSTNGLVALSTHLRATLRARARLHRHTALANGKGMPVCTVIPMACASEFTTHGAVDSSHFLGSDDRVECACKRN